METGLVVTSSPTVHTKPILSQYLPVSPTESAFLATYEIKEPFTIVILLQQINIDNKKIIHLKI